VPIELLSEADQRVVARTKQLGPQIAADHLRMEREQAEREAEATEAAE
jgi:hypothetical protein